MPEKVKILNKPDRGSGFSSVGSVHFCIKTNPAEAGSDCLYKVVFVESVAALGAELRRMLRVCGSPAALITLILLGCSGLRLTAVRAELCGVL